MNEYLTLEELQETLRKLKAENRMIMDELVETKHQLSESNDIIDAIRTGKVDAIVLEGENGHQVFTLKNADKTYRIFIEKMTEGAVTLNSSGIILYSNSSFARLVQMPLEKIIGTLFLKYINYSEVEKYETTLSAAWESDRKAEFNLIDSEQRIIPCNVSLTALKLEEGLCISVILTDLTVHKESQRLVEQQNEQLARAREQTENLNASLEDKVRQRTRELTESREHFKFLADNIPVMAWTSLANGHVTYFNKRWFQYTGCPLEESEGWAWEKVVHPDDLPACLIAWTKSINTGKPYSIEYRFKNGLTGEYRWHLGKALPYLNEDGSIQLWFGTCTDIEDQKRIIEKKDEFIGIASHELKTPLTTLKGYLQLIESFKKEELHPTVKMFTSKASDSLGRLQDLVDDLLDVSKIQAGKFHFEVSQLSIRHLLENCAENARLINPNHKIHMELEGDWTVDGNMRQLEQVLMNLVNNAVKYSPGKKEIFIKAVLNKEGMVKISVRDLGLGLSEDQVALIFERFYRVEDKKHFTSGLGMGLFISSNIVEKHQGYMGVDSTLGKGSTFWFTLPVK